MKFDVGDYVEVVRCIIEGDGDCTGLRGVIVGVEEGDDLPYMLDNYLCFNEDELELIEEVD